MIDWLQNHVWLCTYIIAGLAILTFLFNFVFKHIHKEADAKEVRKVKMKASHNKKSNLYQSAGDITINPNKE